jgi:hypothetical protein
LGKPDYVSSTGRWDYYGLRPDRGTCGPHSEAIMAGLANVTLRPPLLYPGPGITVSPKGYSNDGGSASLRIVTLHEAGWPQVSVTFALDSPTSSLLVRLPDGTKRGLAPGFNRVTWSGPVTGPETPIRIERTGGAGVYHVRGISASANLSADASACLAKLAAKVSTGS